MSLTRSFRPGGKHGLSSQESRDPIGFAVAALTKVAQSDLTGARRTSMASRWRGTARRLVSSRATEELDAVDGEIDPVLSGLRTSNPSQADSAAALNTLAATMNAFDGV